MKGRAFPALVGALVAVSLQGTVLALQDARAELRKIGPELTKALKESDARAIAGLLNRMGSIDDPGVARYLLAAIAVPSAENYDRAANAIAGYRNAETIEEFVDQLLGSKKAKDFRQRVLILDGFGRRSDEVTRDAIYKSLEDGVVHVQVAAIHACVARKEKEAVPPLIDLLEREEKRRTRAWIEARRGLLELTAQDFETVADWRKFWEGNGATLDPKNLDRSKGPTEVVVKKTGDSVEFFGGEVFSENVVFVIDVSGSMIAYDPDPEYKGDREAIDRQRLNRAREQLIRVLRKLRQSSKFNLIAYSDRVLPWQKRIMPAKGGNLRKATKFVKGFKAMGLTHTDEALEKAFEDPGIDTIVLLTDGAPVKQANQDSRALQEQILKRVKDLNASRKLRIDTYGFDGQGVDPRNPQPPQPPPQPPPGAKFVNPLVEFLKKLAEENGGTYRSIK